jgi:hypothetical protein
VLKLLAALARVAFGFALASIAAGLVTVMFVGAPLDALAQPANRFQQTASQTLELALLTATHLGLFAAAFVLIAAGLGESFSIRSLPFYLIAGVAIALLGLTAQAASEAGGQSTILNNYAVTAFLAAGFFGGFVYWLASGQFAGQAPEANEETGSGFSTEALATANVAAPLLATAREQTDDTVTCSRTAETEPRTPRVLQGWFKRFGKEDRQPVPANEEIGDSPEDTDQGPDTSPKLIEASETARPDTDDA